MRTIAIVVLGVAPLAAQVRSQPVSMPETAKVAPAEPGTIPNLGASRVSQESLNVLQSGFDSDLAGFDINDTIDVIGRTRGVYLNDYGVIFTAEISPVITPGITPWVQKIPEDTKIAVHKRKLERMTPIRRLMGQMMMRAADQLKLLPNDQQIVLSVRFLYLPYEYTQGLPVRITMKGDKRSVLAGKYTTDEQAQ